MAQPPDKPEWGIWNPDISYTTYFENERINRGRIRNRNNPEDNPKMSPNTGPAPPTITQEELVGRELPMPSPGRGVPGDLQQSPIHSENPWLRGDNKSSHGSYGQLLAPSEKPGARTEQGCEKSPIGSQQRHYLRPGVSTDGSSGKSSPHPQQQARIVRQDKDNSYGRTRARQTIEDAESPVEDVAVPEFNRLNSNDAEDLTGVFNDLMTARRTPKHPLKAKRCKTSSRSKKSRCCFLG